MTGYLVVANAAAGTADREALEAATSHIPGAVDVVVCDGAEDVDAAVSAVGGRILVVAGGDGTLHLVVQRAHRLGLLDGLTIGLVPMGTGNDFARGLGVPLDAVGAATALGSAAPRLLDLVTTDDEQVVVNAAHAGLGAAAADRSAGLKATLGPLAYPVGALVAGAREAGYRLTVTADGQVVHDGDALMVGVANAAYIGGGTRLCPPAQPDDGLLDLVVVSAVGAAARLAFATALQRAVHLDRDDVAHRRAQTVTITGDGVLHDLDGELTDETTTRTYTVSPQAWRFLTPSSR